VLEGITFRHEPRPGQITHEIAGHLHPAARISIYGTALRRPCFVSNGLRLVMPAFGAFTGGLNVLDDAFEPLFSDDGLAVWVVGSEGLYPVATRLLRRD
jgi:metallophosphoesterase superfamily enzyme